MVPMSEPPESERYVIPRWPDGAFNLVALEGGFELGPCTAESWDVADNGAITDWRADGAHPIHLRVRMQAGDLLYANNGDIGDMTYRIVPVAEDGVTSATSTAAFDLDDEFAALWAFLDRGSLTTAISLLERDLDGSEPSELPEILARYGITPAALESSLIARDRLGRINDIIHALAIATVLPTILEPGEILERPSLGAGNDSTRPFDIETDRRVAEFKMSRWDGHDAARMRQLAKDFVHLAADESGRRAELYVLDDRPGRFLRTSGSTMAWALGRFPASKELFIDRFGDLETVISDFCAEAASHVEIIDLRPRLGRLMASDCR
jgi:hypothetical protein